MATEKFCETRTIVESQSESVRPLGRNGPFIASIPIVISQTKLHINIETKVNLEQPVISIRNCERDVYISHCKLLDLGNKRYGKIYMNGYIRENIEYTTEDSVKNQEVHGHLRYITVKIPFDCAARVDYFTPPTIEVSNRFIPVDLVGVNRDSGNAYCVNTSEKLYCDLGKVNILEVNITEDQSDNSLNTLNEQMMIFITFTLLQNQMVNIPRNTYYSG